MLQVEITGEPTPADRAAARRLVESEQVRIGRRPVSDAMWLQLTADDPGSLGIVLCRDGDRDIGVGLVSRKHGESTIELVRQAGDEAPGPVLDPVLDPVLERLLTGALDIVRTAGGGPVTWWAFDTGDGAVHAAVATSAELVEDRVLLQMRVRLPLPADPGTATTNIAATDVAATNIAATKVATTDVVTRPFEVGRDEDAWLAVNNAAFAAHAEQGKWTIDAVRAREAEPWFDPAGFLLHERDERLAAFCWTKLHTDTQPVLGEIYVIAVHPDFHGLGLGRALTVAGLHSIAARGVRTGMLYVDGANAAAVGLYTSLGFIVHQTDRAYVGNVNTLPHWSVADLHESFESRSFADAMERASSDADRLVALFDEVAIGAMTARPPTADDGDTAARVIDAYNATASHIAQLRAFVYATVATDTRHARAQALMSSIEAIDARVLPLVARLAEWVAALGPAQLAPLHPTVADHLGPLLRLADRAEHQMSQAEEHLFAEMSITGSSAWSRMQREVTSQLTAQVALAEGPRTMPINAVRGLATHADSAVRRAAYDAELEAWPRIATTSAAAINAIKGEANTANRRRRWASPLDASLFANSVSRPTFEAMRDAVVESLPRFRQWMRTKATLHGHSGPLPWWDLVAPLPDSTPTVSWHDGLTRVHDAFATYSPALAALVDRAIDQRWVDAEPRDGKVGGAFCMSLVDERSLVLLNWSGSLDSVQTTAHELGHAYHNVQLAQRTPLQRRLPMALAETASIFCETLMVEAGLASAPGNDRLALLDVDLQGSTQVVVDIYSRLLFETEVFERRRTSTISAAELNSMMVAAQAEAYGDGLDHTTAHPYMWILKPHYYNSHFYNWPYTYGLLFGLGLFAKYRDDPDRFRAGYDDLLSRAGMNTAEELGQEFGFDVTDCEFWRSSLNVIGDRIDQYRTLAAASHA
jgi:oligoendopeptidase F